MVVVILPPPDGSPRPATGAHAELLEEISQAAQQLIRCVELERSGICDGQGFWIISDPIVNKARQIVTLAEQRTTENGARHGPSVTFAR